MYWSGLYSHFLYGNVASSSLSKSQFDIELIGFNSYDFSDIIISNIPDSYDKNSFDIQTYERSTHWQGLSNWLIRDKTITIHWWIVAEDKEELENKIGRIKANLLIGEWNLYLKKAFWILQTKAVVSKLVLPRESWSINSIQISIIFKILDPFFYSLKMNEVWYFDVNDNLAATLSYYRWTYNAKPSVFISFKEAEFVSNVSVKINNKRLAINEKIVSWDSLSVLSEKLDVAKNGKYWVDWLWEFWELEIWENDISIEIDWEFLAEIFVKWRDTYV